MTDSVADDEAGADAPTEFGPSPEYGPEDVVRSLISGITGDGDTAVSDDRAVCTLFDLAAPSLRASHGSLAEFDRAFSTPIFRSLLDATSIERGPIEHTDGRAVQTVLAKHPDGDSTYEVVLEPQSAGKYEGCWMIETVSLVYNGVSPSFRQMPTVVFEDTELKCDEGDLLRDVLLRASGYSPYNDITEVANCGGNGLCGTCAVEVSGETSEKGRKEAARLKLPPHNEDSGLRLSCQTRVYGDVTVTKHDGLWGQHMDAAGGEKEEQPERIPVTEAEYDGTYEYDPAVL